MTDPRESAHFWRVVEEGQMPNELPRIPYTVTDRLGAALKEVPNKDFVAAVDGLRLAQHRATRKATLEEVRAMTYRMTVVNLHAWLTAQLEVDDHD